ncbi:PAS domain S-box-containing protein/diguanylate cyclase (GGDEF) domain-containing protein [Paenibacillus sp. UNCCL117]|uniref:sensor domain-containing diguanylate cyclase n=1 Tax=unclassified Paenibacillus TaxID=185978 RepID=UPI000887FB2E|nr:MULTISPECIES: diguanylate cyclase [unclassified Paenibacillus]SDE51294.1 PAS domain S-box-containing protein/diguanylate cyclase (GGDEF) domain-containing protein [Paenibacillus sp. cl123]SFW67176.1 PAS domain S-box-containing protein/diguanylate cyclase (GGDEF) domain-containing protein [Paenibacillus sp. UNCCL117]
MFKDFIINASILVASLFLIGQLFMKRPLTRQSPLTWKVFGSVCFGLLGLLLMAFTLRVEANVIADLRHIPLVIAALQGGPVVSFLTAVLIVTGRLSLFGVSLPSITSGIMILSLSLVFGALSGRRGLTMPRFLLFNAIGLSFISVVMGLNLYWSGNLDKLTSVLIYHWVFSGLVGVLSVYVFLYIVRSHAATVKLKESEERYRRLISSSPDATFVIARSGIITFANDKGLQLLRAISRKDVVDRPYKDFVEPAYQEKLSRYWDGLMAHKLKPELFEQQFVCLDGTLVETEMSISLTFYKDEQAILISVRDVTERKRTEKKLQEALDQLQKLSDLDGLTGIPNRRRLDHFLSHAWTQGQAEQTELTLFLLDVDYFKRYNDSYGHLKGDEVLRTIAREAHKQLSEDGHFVARYGGEEFAAVLKGVSLQEATRIAERLRVRIEQLALAHERSKIADHVTVSIGLASAIPDPCGLPDELLSCADKALYRAKEEGRNRVAAYVPESAGSS